jgi:hypothetical protein
MKLFAPFVLTIGFFSYGCRLAEAFTWKIGT